MGSQTIFNAMLENNCSESASRMSAMENSTKSAGEMLNKLTLSYNRCGGGTWDGVGVGNRRLGTGMAHGMGLGRAWTFGGRWPRTWTHGCMCPSWASALVDHHFASLNVCPVPLLPSGSASPPLPPSLLRLLPEPLPSWTPKFRSRYDATVGTAGLGPCDISGRIWTACNRLMAFNCLSGALCDGLLTTTSLQLV